MKRTKDDWREGEAKPRERLQILSDPGGNRLMAIMLGDMGMDMDECMEVYQALSTKLLQWKDARGLATRAGPDKAGLARAIRFALCGRDMIWCSSDFGWSREAEELVRNSHEVLGPASTRSTLDGLMIYEVISREVPPTITALEMLIDGKVSRSHDSGDLDTHSFLGEERIPNTEQDTRVSNDSRSESDVDHDVLKDAQRFLRTLAVWTSAGDSGARPMKSRRPEGYPPRKRVQNHTAFLKAAAAGLACPSILMLATFSSSNLDAHLQARTFNYSSGTISATLVLKRERNTQCFAFPEMLLMPSVPEFLVACSVYSTVTVLTYQLDRKDQQQRHFLMTGVLFGVLLGMLMGWDMKEIVLGLLPFMASLSLWSSQIFHRCVAREGVVWEV